MKKTNNKGFSLVELIVVVAIMAVLMVVVAPQLLRYVEKTRAQKDASAVAEVAHVVEIATADETIFNDIQTAGGGSVVVVDNAEFTGSPASLVTEAKAAFVGGKIDLSSSTYSSQTCTITVSIVGGVPSVTYSWAAPTP